MVRSFHRTNRQVSQKYFIATAVILSAIAVPELGVADCVTAAQQAIPVTEAAMDALRRNDDAAYCRLVPELLRVTDILSREIRAGCPAASIKVATTIIGGAKEMLRTAPKYCKRYGDKS
jgi:hypothetical protein